MLPWFGILRESNAQDTVINKAAALKFTAKASTLTTPQLFTLGQQLRKENAPELSIALIIDIIWDRDGEETAERFSDAVSFGAA
jgi:hypothetical protein